MARLLAPHQWASCARRVALSNPSLGPGLVPLRSFGRLTTASTKTLSIPSSKSILLRGMSATAICRPTPSTSPAGFFTSRRLASTAFVNTSTGKPTKAEDVTPVSEEPLETPTLAPPVVGHWLIGCAGLVFAIVVVGGITRLTESGLSIVEWRPVTGILPPLNDAEWEEEFTKYKATPEFKLLVQIVHHIISI